jgi:membrane protein DedA with SNARE-associated domain
MAAGFAVNRGWMALWAAVVAATAGNLVGSLVAYGIGRATAQRGQRRSARSVLVRCDELFVRYGGWGVFLARLMPLARTFVSLPAGHARVRLGRFVLMTIAGCAIWAILFVLLGMLAGNGWDKLSGTIGDVLLALAVMGLVGAFVAQRRRRRLGDGRAVNGPRDLQRCSTRQRRTKLQGGES